MSKKSLLSDAIGSIQSSKAHIVPKEQKNTQDLKVTYPPGENVTQDTISTAVIETSSDEKGDLKGPEPEKVRLTPEEKTALTLQKLRKGFTRIPNSILIEIVYGNLSKAEIKILLLIARYQRWWKRISLSRSRETNTLLTSWVWSTIRKFLNLKKIKIRKNLRFPTIQKMKIFHPKKPQPRM